MKEYGSDKIIWRNIMSSQGSISKRPKMDEGSGSGVQRSTSPKEICNLGTHNITDIINTAAFVDKSLFIKAFFERQNSMIVTLAPRRFGKSTNMDMLKEFLLGNKKLFIDNKLKIWEEERAFFDKNCLKNPIIHVDFKGIRGMTEDKIFDSIKVIIQRAYGHHQYLLKEIEDNWTWSDVKMKRVDLTIEKFMQYWKSPETLSEADVICGFQRLSQCLYVYHGKPVYALIDEYDHPIMNAIIESNPGAPIVNQTIKLISEIMSSFLKGNKYMKGALINACVRIAEVPSGGANNIIYYEFLNDFAPYYGFTDKEVQDLFEREEFATLRDSKDEIQEWYNGYQVMGTSGDSIYSSYSILRFLQESIKKERPMFASYWVGTGNITNMKAIFVKCGIRGFVEQLINGEEVEISTDPKMTKENVQTLMSLIHGNINGEVYTGTAHLFLQFLSDNGYLNVIKHNTEYTSTVKVPNSELKKILAKECYNAEFMVEKYNLQSQRIRDYTNAIYLVLEKRNENGFITFANAVSLLFLGSTMPKNEDELHCILFTLLYNNKTYHTRSEMSVKRIKRLGRLPHLDILVILGCKGMIIKLKFDNECSENAHKQIKTEGYFTAFDEYQNITEKILLGLHMNVNRKVSITYSVNDSRERTITSNTQLG